MAWHGNIMSLILFMMSCSYHSYIVQGHNNFIDIYAVNIMNTNDNYDIVVEINYYSILCIESKMEQTLHIL
jgi:hypothetical protein